MEEQGIWWWKMLKGVGEQAADKIADAFAAFWEKHPEFCQDAEPAEENDDDDTDGTEDDDDEDDDESDE